MTSFRRFLLCALLLGVVGDCAAAQRFQADLPDPTQGYDWREEAKKSGLSLTDIETLGQRKVLMVNEAFRQVFEPYIRTRLPVFVTSDSLLNAFHVLYEESVLRFERTNARTLAGVLRHLWDNLEAVDQGLEVKPELLLAAKTRAQIVIGTALRLLGDRSVKIRPEMEKLVRKEVGKVEAALAVEKPEWLGPPESDFVALDYSRYKPRGFYTTSEELERHFRAVSWLQSVPFRVAVDEELVAILLLGTTVEDNRFFRCYTAFVGAGDDWDVVAASRAAQGKSVLGLLSHLGPIRERLLEKAARRAEGPEINDQIRFPPGDPLETAEANFRILSAYRTPDAVLFHRTTDLRQFSRPFPTGLEVLTALGSPYAQSRLSYGDREKLLRTIDECRPFFQESTLYCDYLGCLEALLDEPEPDAPPFMSSEAWRIKSCQTALAGWAQLRHTWALQAKETAGYLGDTRLPPGFVEPEPEFFARMARLIDRTARLLDQEGAFIRPLWHRLATVCRQLESLAHKQLRKVPLTAEENHFLKRYGKEIAGIMLYGGNAWLEPRDDAPVIADVYTNPFVKHEKPYLKVGIARPRALYVLYPYKGGEVAL